MPRYYESLVARQRAALTREQYIEACVIYQKRYGRLRYSALKGALAVAVGLLFLISLFAGGYVPKEQVLGMALLAAVSAAGFGFMGYYLLFGQKKRERDWAQRAYDESPLPGLEQEIAVYRDSFELKNEYEMMTGFWSECGGCCRGGELLVVDTSPNLSRNMLVFSAASTGSEEFERLCGHFKSVFFKKYSS